MFKRLSMDVLKKLQGPLIDVDFVKNMFKGPVRGYFFKDNPWTF